MDKQLRADLESRWGARQNRSTGDPNYQDKWYSEQCGGCLHWLALAGSLGDDWGVCSSPSSPLDGTARFEHDGCQFYEDDPRGFGIVRG